MNALLCETHYNISENYILPNLCALLLVKFAKEDDMNTQRVDYMEGPRSNKYSMTEPSERISHNFWFPKAMEAHEDILGSLLSLVFNATRAELFGISIVRADQF
jgi:hypothetical protein